LQPTSSALLITSVAPHRDDMNIARVYTCVPALVRNHGTRRDVITRMLDVAVDGPSGLDVGFDAFSLDGYDDAQLDELPFGVVGVDGGGQIVRYNLAEARLARLDRSQVLGRDFFRQIAPCTATPEFEGRFRSFVSGLEPRISFPYVFDFKFGAQEVQVEIVRGSREGRYYLCINRLKFRPPRPAYQPVAAPRQAELVPGEDAFGVRRDDAEQRVVVMPAVALRALRLTWDKIAPQGWSLFSAEWGFRWGRLATIDIDTELQERRDLTLRDLPLDEALELIRAHIDQDGWGQVNIDVTSPTATSRGAAIITLERSALAEAAGASALPRCGLVGGVLRAMLSHVSQRVLAIREVRCVSQGAPRCEMVAVAHARRARLDAAAAAATDLRGVLAGLDGAGGDTSRAGDVLARLF